MGAVPTAFRARHAEDLLPTLKQLQHRQPNVTLKWFERGRFWNSPEASREAQIEKRNATAGRGRGWRPGGNHEDPRAKYDVPRDVRRARFKERLRSNQQRDSPIGSDTAKPAGATRRPPPPRPDERPKLSWKPRPGPPQARRADERRPEDGRGTKTSPQSPRSGDRRPRNFESGDRESRPRGTRPWSDKPSDQSRGGHTGDARRRPPPPRPGPRGPSGKSRRPK